MEVARFMEKAEHDTDWRGSANNLVASRGAFLTVVGGLLSHLDEEQAQKCLWQVALWARHMSDCQHVGGD